MIKFKEGLDRNQKLLIPQKIGGALIFVTYLKHQQFFPCPCVIRYASSLQGVLSIFLSPLFVFIVNAELIRIRLL